MRIHIGPESLSDGVLLTRLLVFLVLAWPLIVTMLVYAVCRSRISRKRVYLLTSAMVGYGLSPLSPIAMLVFFSLLGSGAEAAAFYTIVLSIPVVTVLPFIVAFRTARADQAPIR